MTEYSPEVEPRLPQSVKSVPLTSIAEQRTAKPSWPDFHPEDFCHRCGNRNLRSWYVASDLWDAAWSMIEPGIQSVLCPPCFDELWEKATGIRMTWELRPDTAVLMAKLRRATSQTLQPVS